MEVPAGTNELFAGADGSALFALGTNIYKVSADGKVAQEGTLKNGERLMGEGLTARGCSLYKDGAKVADGLIGLQAVQELAGGQYVALCDARAKSKGNVWVVNAGSRALAIAPDYRFCVTGEKDTHHLISTIIAKDGEMMYSESFYHLHDLSNGVQTSAGNMAFDSNGNLYAATEMGVQVADHNGRVRAILSLPAGGVKTLAFSGNYLYVVCGDRMFVRKMKSEGHLPKNGSVMYKSQGQG